MNYQLGTFESDKVLLSRTRILQIAVVDSWYWEARALDRHAVEAARALLSASERVRHDRFLFECDRRDVALAHALRRTILSTYMRCPTDAWTFATAEHGKPFIVSPVIRTLSFNISHTKGFVACAVAPGMDVGIDVETLERKLEVDEFSCRLMAEYEVGFLKRRS